MSWVSDFNSVRLELGAPREKSSYGTQKTQNEKPEGGHGKGDPQPSLSVQAPSATAWVTSHHTKQRVGVGLAEREGIECSLGPCLWSRLPALSSSRSL